MPIRGVFLVPVQEVSVEAVNGTRTIAGALDADGVFLTFPRMDDCVDDFHGVQDVRGECKGKTGVKERFVLFNHGDVQAGSRDDIRGCLPEAFLWRQISCYISSRFLRLWQKTPDFFHPLSVDAQIGISHP